VNQPLHGEAEDGLLGADGVPACHHPARLGHDCRRRAQDARHHIGGHALGEGRHVEREDDPAAHGEHVAARVGRGDGTEVIGVVDERWKEVGGRHQGQVVAQLEHSGVVEGRQSDKELGGWGGHGEIADELGQWRGTPLGRAATAARPLGEAHGGGHDT
jgi:hypothetical protein